MQLHKVSVIIRGEEVDSIKMCSVDEAIGFARQLRKHDVRCKVGVTSGVPGECELHGNDLAEMLNLMVMAWQGMR
jgi:hypothetical protein